jgi:ABC-type multidrug transport system fused ATPase/permease subunit
VESRGHDLYAIRFTTDMTNIDISLMLALVDTVDTTLDCLVVIGVVCVNIPFMLVLMAPVMVVVFRYAVLYLRSSRELKRLESIAKSPLYAQFSESLTGLSTIRAYQAQGTMLQRCFEFLDVASRTHYYLWVSPRWLTVRIQTIGAIVSGAVGLFLIMTAGREYGLSPTQAGLALLYSLQFTAALNWCLRSEAQLEMFLNSVERTEEYCKLDQEAPPVIEATRPPPGWPTRGGVEFDGVVLRYAPHLSQVLRGVSFTVTAGSRVGIVGRTGAGKSSLLVALFRLVEPEAGDILIDGVSVLRMGLRDLRSAIAIVPQDPVLFRGSIRDNLSPRSSDPTTTQYHSDALLWEALERVCMKDYVESLPNALDSEVTEGGSNLSVGQRQLLCMARAMLKHARLIVLDEATANVDRIADEVCSARCSCRDPSVSTAAMCRLSRTQSTRSSQVPLC